MLFPEPTTELKLHATFAPQQVMLLPGSSLAIEHVRLFKSGGTSRSRWAAYLEQIGNRLKHTGLPVDQRVMSI